MYKKQTNIFFDKSTIHAQGKRYRVNFINSLSGLKTAYLVGSCSKTGDENLALFTSIVHLGADPALIGMISRPDVVPRDTLANIRETGAYTLNLVSQSFYREAHQTSARYEPHESEFTATGLEPEYKKDFAAPFVKQSPLVIGMQLKEISDIHFNNTHLIIGEVQWVQMAENVINEEDGLVNIGLLLPVMVGGLDDYHGVSHLERLPYAKKHKL